MVGKRSEGAMEATWQELAQAPSKHIYSQAVSFQNTLSLDLLRV